MQVSQRATILRNIAATAFFLIASWQIHLSSAGLVWMVGFIVAMLPIVAIIRDTNTPPEQAEISFVAGLNSLLIGIAAVLFAVYGYSNQDLWPVFLVALAIISAISIWHSSLFFRSLRQN
jgi:hypothetical protein